MAVRTMFFDDFFLDATDAGITQAVILASGLDSRAYRLAWPAGTVGLRDRPARRHRVQDAHAGRARRRADRRSPHRRDRPALRLARRAEGRPASIRSMPTAWSAEGLLGYLPPDAQDRLLDTITELSAPGSRFATESAPTIDPADHDEAVRADAGGRRAVARARLRSRLRRADLPRRPQRGRELPGRPRLAGRRAARISELFDRARARPRSTTRTWPVRRTALRQRHARAALDDPHRRRQLGPGVQRRGDRDHGRRGAGAGHAESRTR